MFEGVAGVLAVLFILAVLFMLVRGLLLWYWRVPELLTVLRSIDDRLRQLRNELKKEE